LFLSLLELCGGLPWEEALDSAPLVWIHFEQLQQLLVLLLGKWQFFLFLDIVVPFSTLLRVLVSELLGNESPFWPVLFMEFN